MKEQVQPNSLAEASALLRNIADEQNATWAHNHLYASHVTTEEGDQLPIYTHDEANAQDRLQDLAATLCSSDSTSLPITSYPKFPISPSPEEAETIITKQRMLSTYFTAIEKANIELLSLLLSLNLVTPETTNQTGKTPLLAAVEAGKLSSVKHLLQADAPMDAYGIIATSTTYHRRKRRQTDTYRTPLQYAAQLGNLALVKFLVEAGADDALIAPDGQLALRLAATNGHEEIVAYLPRRRGGGVKRWKAKHNLVMRRAKKAARGIYKFGKVVVWHVPKFFVWTVPKHVIVFPLLEAVKWVREHAKEIPGLIVKRLIKLWEWTKALPGQVWKGIKAMPGMLKDTVNALRRCITYCAKVLWKTMTRIPHALNIGVSWVCSGIKKTGLAICHVCERFFAFVHTLASAMADFFQRITLNDVYRALRTCLHALIFDLPRALWDWIGTCGVTVAKMMKAVFGFLGEVLWALACALVACLLYVPKKVVDIGKACGSSVGKAGEEVLVWMDPKRV